MVEEGLQLLVREVDAQLLERVVLEAFEAEDVEDADEIELPGLGKLEIDLLHEKVKQVLVKRLGESVAREGGIRGLPVLQHDMPGRYIDR